MVRQKLTCHRIGVGHFTILGFHRYGALPQGGKRGVDASGQAREEQRTQGKRSHSCDDQFRLGAHGFEARAAAERPGSVTGAALIHYCQPECYRRVKCIWFVRLFHQ